MKMTFSLDDVTDMLADKAIRLTGTRGDCNVTARYYYAENGDLSHVEVEVREGHVPEGGQARPGPFAKLGSRE